MAYHVFSLSFVIAIVVLLRFVFGNYIIQRLKYTLWLVVLVKLLVPVPLFSSSLSLQGFVNHTMEHVETYTPAFISEKNVENIGKTGINDNTTYTSQSANTIQGTNKDTILENPASTTTQAYSEKSWSFSLIIKIIWMTGMICCFFVFFMGNFRLKIHLRRERKKLVLEDCSLPVYVSGVIHSPCLFGVIHPTIYLTEDALKNPESLTYILTHEQVHYRQKDHIWAFLKVLCLCMYWFHPLVWYAVWLASKDSESACDEQTVKILGESYRRAYGESLIKISTMKSRKQDIFICTTGITKGQNDLKERLELLVKKTRNHTFAVIMILLIVVCLAGCTFSRPVKTSGENIQKQDNYVENISLPKEEMDNTDHVVTTVEERETDYKKDGLIYEEVPDWVIGNYHWANVVEAVEINKTKKKISKIKEPKKWFQSLDGKYKIKVRRWDNLICSCDKYLIYEYDGMIYVAKPDALYEPIFSFSYTTEFMKISSGYVIAYPRDNRILYYDESFHLTKEYTGYKVGEDGGDLYRDGYMAVRDIQTGLMGFMDETGMLKIPCQYSYTEGFVNGYCPVLVDAKMEQFKEEDGSIMFDAEGGYWGIIDTNGLYVLEPSEEFENVDSANSEEDYYCGARRFGPVQAGGIVDFIAVDQEDTVVKTVKIAFNTPVR